MGKWKSVSIGQLMAADALLVKSGFAQRDHNSDGDGVPHLRPFNVTEEATIDLSQIKSVPPPPADRPFWLKPNDVLFNNTNIEDFVGKTALFPLSGRFVISNHMTLLRVLDRSRLDPFWLAMAFYHKWRHGYFRPLCRRHVNQAGVRLDRLKEVQLHLPPLSEQKAIVRVLRTVQQAQEGAKRVILACRQVKESLLGQLFARTEDWEVRRLGELVEIAYGVRAAILHNTDPTIGVPILTPVNVSIDGAINLSPLRYFDLPERSKLMLRRGDLLFNWRNDNREHFGKAALFDLPGEYTFGSFILRLRSLGLVENEYLYYYLCWLKAQGVLFRSRTSFVNPAFNASAVSRLQVTYPGAEERGAIVGMLRGVDRKLLAETAKKTALDALFKSILDSLMAGAAGRNCYV